MKIGIVGSGIVGRILGSAFIAEGNEVMLGTRDVQKKEVVKWLSENPAAKAGSFEETAAFGLETEDMGKVEAARAIEPLCILWCLPGILRNQWTHAFKLLKK